MSLIEDLHVADIADLLEQPLGTALARHHRALKKLRALMTADPQTHSVTQIALDTGFSHLGRFSVAYRAYFGEAPRETLGTP